MDEHKQFTRFDYLLNYFVLVAFAVLHVVNAVFLMHFVVGQLRDRKLDGVTVMLLLIYASLFTAKHLWNRRWTLAKSE